MIVIAFVAVMSVQIIRVYQKDQEYMQQEASLQKQLEEETARGEQLSSYETYTKSQQYVEDTAKSKLGLAYDNEIIFHDVRMTQMELVFCYLLFYDGVDFIQLFFGERSMSDDTDIV